MDRGFSSNIQHPVREGAITVDFGDIRSLQIMADKLKRPMHTLKLNGNLCDHLKAFSTRIKFFSSQETARLFCQCEIMIDNYIFQNETHISQLDPLVNRARGVGSLVSLLRANP